MMTSSALSKKGLLKLLIVLLLQEVILQLDSNLYNSLHGSNIQRRSVPLEELSGFQYQKRAVRYETG
jgi:hypothetical protein